MIKFPRGKSSSRRTPSTSATWTSRFDPRAARDWLRRYVEPVGPMEVVHVRAWSTVARVETALGRVYFKACAPVQWHEPYLSQQLSGRWRDRVAEVLAIDAERGWMLMRDAGDSLMALGNKGPEVWLDVLPRYAELQRGEAAHVDQYLAHGVPDLGLEQLPARFAELIARANLPLEPPELRQLVTLQESFAQWCVELGQCGIPPSVQHDDLHQGNVYVQARHARVLDWGDAWIGHPFMSLVETFRFVEDESWHPRLRDAYLEPWGAGHRETFELAIRVGGFAHAIAWLRQRDMLHDQSRPAFDQAYAVVLRRALAEVG